MESGFKKDILDLLASVKREGMPELIEWLTNGCDYFTAPSSTQYHGNYDGGLADHSLNVYDSLTLLHKEYVEGKGYPIDSLIIVALLHDLCKVNYYIKDEDPATSAQIKYMKDLIGNSGEAEVVSEKHMTKAYVSKVIDHYKNTPDEPFPAYTPFYKVKDEFPMGHGEKSLCIIQRYIALTDEEALAIRWHLGGYDPGFHFFFPSGAPAQQAIKNYPLVPLLISADFLATWMVDQTIK
jgi:hypothetical protein